MIGVNRFTSSIVAARRPQTSFISIQKLVKSSIDAPGPGFLRSFPLQLSGMACTKVVLSGKLAHQQAIPTIAVDKPTIH